MFQDKTIVCKDCGQEFTFTANEQEFFAEKGFTNEPQRCKPCRDARKGASNNRQGGERQMFDAVCASCGRSCKVPFQPRTDRPVYCSDWLRPAKTASRVSAGRRFTFFVYSPAPIAGRIAFVLGFLPRHFLRFDDQRAVR